MKDDTINTQTKSTTSSGRHSSPEPSRISNKRSCHEHGEDCPSENEREFESLEYEEDVYYSNFAATPSFDDIDELSGSEEIIVHCWRDPNGELDDIIVDDADLSAAGDYLRGRETNFSNVKRKRRSIRVVLQEFSKPYLTKISNSQNYKKLLELVKGFMNVFLFFV